MVQRADYFGLAEGGMKILMEQEAYLQQQFSESKILTVEIWELVKLRISQINQCAFCIDMHSHSARKQGELPERLIGLSAWKDMTIYSEIERAALLWAEYVTSGQTIADPCYQKTVSILGEKELVVLTIATNAINSWNRIAKTFKPTIGMLNT